MDNTESTKAMSTDEITFYDIASKLGPIATNYSCWKTRLSLNYKGLDYKTVWVKFKDVQETSKVLGTKPTGKFPDGVDRYSFPVIRLPSGDVIENSVVIAKKLDEVYPEKPILQSAGAFAAAEDFFNFFQENVQNPSGSLVVEGFDAILDSESSAYIRRRGAPGVPRAPAKGTSERDEMWANLRAAWEKLGKFLDGREPNLFADFVIVAYLLCMRSFLGKEEWAANCEKWDNGRWLALLKKYEEYTKKNN